MNTLKKTAYLGMVISTIALSGCLGGGGGSSSDIEPQTPQQKRVAAGFFNSMDPQAISSDQNFKTTGLAGFEDSSRWFGVLDGSRYRVEVPANWNGMLVMYAHGFRGEGSALTVDSAPMRQYLLNKGYAWAASSYSTTFYDVRAGVEDTNALALAFNDIATQNSRPLPTPTKRYITGVSMGGHVTAAAVELETQQTANNFVPYDGAAPMCGVLGDTALFDYFGAYNLSLFEFGGVPANSYPITDVPAKLTAARTALWTDYATNKNANGLTPAGLPFYATLQNLSGGPRPVYAVAFGGFQNLLQSFAGTDGTVTGILNRNVVDTRDITYRFQSTPGQPLTPTEQGFNNTIYQITPDANANALRDDGLRFIPKVNGNLYKAIPVVTVHTLGDLFVPISMEQIYNERMNRNGFGNQLVQRAVRAPGHCDFSLAEFEQTLDAMLEWEQNNIKPAGDDFMTPATVANSQFGCQFTVDGAPQTTTRTAISPLIGACAP
jgi:hypothetical protein